LELSDIGEEMKRKTIKAKLAVTLSAGMAFAILASAMPAYAATGNISFDAESKTTFSDINQVKEFSIPEEAKNAKEMNLNGK